MLKDMGERKHNNGTCTINAGSNLVYCVQIMLKDMADSKRTNHNIHHLAPQDLPLQRQRSPPRLDQLSATIISSLYWPPHTVRRCTITDVVHIHAVEEQCSLTGTSRQQATWPPHAVRRCAVFQLRPVWRVIGQCGLLTYFIRSRPPGFLPCWPLRLCRYLAYAALPHLTHASVLHYLT